MSEVLLRTVSGQALPGIEYFCTTRHGGVSTGSWAALNLGLHTGDDPKHVHRNRQRLGTQLPGQPVWLNQVHGTDVFDADCPTETTPTADAVFTTRPNQPLIIMTADCLPVVIASSDGRVLGVAHAGWRGLAAGVLENIMQAMTPKAGANATWHAWIGPAISQPCFEVGEDVVQAFVATDDQAEAYFIPGARQGKWLADLPGLARRRLARLGINQVQLSGYCTYTDTQRFFSYRRTATTGRLATVAWLTGI